MQLRLYHGFAIGILRCNTYPNERNSHYSYNYCSNSAGNVDRQFPIYSYLFLSITIDYFQVSSNPEEKSSSVSKKKKALKCSHGLGENPPGDSSWPFLDFLDCPGFSTFLSPLTSSSLPHFPRFLLRWLLSLSPCILLFFDTRRFASPNRYCIFLHCIRTLLNEKAIYPTQLQKRKDIISPVSYFKVWASPLIVVKISGDLL